jgi:hypothetical protein
VRTDVQVITDLNELDCYVQRILVKMMKKEEGSLEVRDVMCARMFSQQAKCGGRPKGCFITAKMIECLEER